MFFLFTALAGYGGTCAGPCEQEGLTFLTLGIIILGGYTLIHHLLHRRSRY